MLGCLRADTDQVELPWVITPEPPARQLLSETSVHIRRGRLNDTLCVCISSCTQGTCMSVHCQFCQSIHPTQKTEEKNMQNPLFMKSTP